MTRAMTERFSYELLGRDGAARLGVIHTPRGDVRTPAFMPVGTAGTVKAMLPESVRATGHQLSESSDHFISDSSNAVCNKFQNKT